jgi:hypothetical protein
MASLETADRDRIRTGTTRGSTYEETKPSFKTGELMTMIGVVLALLIASAIADNFEAPGQVGSRHVETDR